MAQPTVVKEILGSIVVPAHTPISNSTIISSFAGANMTKVKTEGVRVSVNGYPLIPATYDAEDYISPTNHTQLFDKETLLLVGRYVVIT